MFGFDRNQDLSILPFHGQEDSGKRPNGQQITKNKQIDVEN